MPVISGRTCAFNASNDQWPFTDFAAAPRVIAVKPGREGKMSGIFYLPKTFAKEKWIHR